MSHRRSALWCGWRCCSGILLAWLGFAASAAEDGGATASGSAWRELWGPEANPFDALRLEAHGFASFGYLQTWGNDWLANTTAGSAEFWEAALNAQARPLDRLRLGVQIFARDLGRYDNGAVQLDLAYADYRFADAFGLQVGRFRLPAGLYNEVLDVDAARTPVFLPPSIYSLRMRDVYISTDGVKVYGYVPVGEAGALEYQAFGGHKEYDEELGFAAYFRDLGYGERIDTVSVRALLGGMLHWHTPIEGFGLRATLTDAHGLRVVGSSPSRGQAVETLVDNYWIGVVSAIYERGDWTFAAEYCRNVATGDTRLYPSGRMLPLVDNSDGAYVSATWRVRRWLETYAAIECAWADPSLRSDSYRYTGVLAVNLLPLEHWSLKAEFRDNLGTYSVSPIDAPHGKDDHWQSLALKTTVDF